MKPGGYYHWMIHTMRQDDEYNPESVVGILFAKPNVAFVKDEILDRTELECANMRSGQDIDFFFAGYSKTDEYEIDTLDENLIVAPGGQKWRYDGEMFANFVKRIEDTSKWEYSSEPELLLLYFRGTDLRFDKSLVICLESAIRNTCIRSVSKLFNKIFGIVRSKGKGNTSSIIDEVCAFLNDNTGNSNFYKVEDLSKK